MGIEAQAERVEDLDLNPFVFLVGCPRSGTTLLQRIVNAHSQIAITPETHWLPRYFVRRIGLTPEGLVTPALVPRLLEHPRFSDLGMGRIELEQALGNGEPPSYARYVSALFACYGRAQGKWLVGDKTPGYVRKIRTLHLLWPRAKFVHLIRDGRDVCLSALSWGRKADRMARLYSTWAGEPTITAALWWAEHVRRGRQRGQVLGPQRYYEMRYEALVSQPAAECARLCQFLGVLYEDVMLRFHEGHIRNDASLSAKDAWLPVTPGLRNWRTQMSTGEVERFEAAAGHLLDELGYPRAVPCPAPETLRRVAHTVALFPRKGRQLSPAPGTIKEP
jgi:hypothetical protein